MKSQDPPNPPSSAADALPLAAGGDGNATKQEPRATDAQTRMGGADTRDHEIFRASELRYRRLFEAARDGILILEADTGKISDVNPFLVEMLGYSHAELVGTSIWELGPFKDIVSNKAKFEELQRHGYVRYENLPLEARDGRKIAVEFVSNVYQEGAGRVIQCNVRDITERTEAEKQRMWVAAIVEYSAEAVVTTTAKGIVIGWNAGAQQLYGYTGEEIIGHSVSALFPPESYREYLQIMEKVRKREVVEAYDTVRRKKDGTLVNVSVDISPIEARDGEVVGATKSSHDIGRIKRLEAQFIEAQKMEVIGHLASGVAHDFNNILAVVMGYSELLGFAVDRNSPLHKYAEEIGHASERAVGLTRQLLIFSRKETVKPAVLDLNEVVKDLEKMLRRLVDENIEMTIVLGDKNGPIKADPGYIGQVVMNLVVNARDAMPDGGKLTITTSNVVLDETAAGRHAKVLPGDYVMLCIRDTGTGMTDEVKAHLFEAFFTTKPKGKGTGLGLVTCQTIVQQSGGYIDVSSEIGKGTTFRIYFPRVEQALDAMTMPKPSGSLPRGTETLLVVEDEPGLRHMSASVLEGQGYTVLRAPNGQDGLHVARQHKGPPISLVVTDVIMPRMGGKVMAEWLKATYPEIKVLFTSGYTDDSIAKDGVLESGVAFLPKPYMASTLTRKVREMLDEKMEKVAV
ncbi:MAG: PAS domain S-box protein [Chthoniobacter sp.]|uniref:hybrid sensor histidine kinase/response regulator n=1 Tax=Chthoniobacter sp. TaxID=2510640 RepID=UPI0032AAF63F